MIPIALGSVSVSYDGKTVVDDLSLQVEGGSWIGIVGPNGAGKTTVLRAIAGLVPFRGHVTLGAEDVSGLGRRSLARLVAYVPQQPLIPVSTSVTDYVLMGRTPYISYFGIETRRDLDAVSDALDRLELAELADRALSSLSGGELQRVVLARALAQQGPVLLLDEPTTALDVGHQQQALELVDSLRRQHGFTVVSCMHDLTLAAQYVDELVLLDAGRHVASGAISTVLTRELIRAHFGADVHLMEDPDGGVVVAPRRPEKARPRTSSARGPTPGAGL